VEEEQRKSFRLFLTFIGGLIVFTILSSVGMHYLFPDQPNPKTFELIGMVILLVTILYLGITEKLDSETIAGLLGVIAGYVLGS